MKDFLGYPVVKRSISLLTLIVFAVQVSGCREIFQKPTLQEGFESLVQEFESQHASQSLFWSRQLKKAVQRALEVAQEMPQLEGKASLDPAQATVFIRANQERIEKYLVDVENGTAPLRRLIYEVSRDAYQNSDRSAQARDQAILYYALQFQRGIHKGIVQAAGPMMIFAGAESLKDVKEIQAFRKSAMTHYFRHFGAQMVSQRDLQVVVSGMKDLKSQGKLPEAIEKNILDVQQKLGQDLADQGKAVTDAITKLGPEEQQKLKDAIQEFVIGLDDASFLYDPDQNFGTAVSILIVIGNLTWGLVNTLIGAGIILWAGALGAMGLIRMPRFSIAQNGHMIYADVSGSNPIGLGGKLSMGLFELDNGTSFHFASGHEGVHALQSALMGPLYLPVVLLSYMVSGFDRGFMEDWAWAWADL